MSNQVYRNQTMKYYAMPGFDQWKKAVDVILNAGSSYQMIFDTPTITVDNHALVKIDVAGNIIFLEEGVYSIMLYLGVTPGSGTALDCSVVIYDVNAGTNLAQSGPQFTYDGSNISAIYVNATCYFAKNAEAHIIFNNQNGASISYTINAASSFINICKVY